MSKQGQNIQSVQAQSVSNVPSLIFQDSPVVLTETLASVYETTARRIQSNYSYNKDRFVRGKHFFRLTGEELRKFKREARDSGVAEISWQAKHLYLWTARGAARHAKMLGTEKAWEVFEALEDNYFQAQTQPLPPTQPESIPVLDFSPLDKSITKKQLARLNCAINALVNFRSMNNKPVTQRELSCSLAREFGLQELQDLSRPRFNKAEEMVLRKIAQESGLRFPEAGSQKIVERQARCDVASGEILQIGHEALSKIRDRAEQALSFGYDCCRVADKRDSHILHHKRQVQCATELFMYTVSLIARSVDLAGEAETICE